MQRKISCVLDGLVLAAGGHPALFVDRHVVLSPSVLSRAVLSRAYRSWSVAVVSGAVDGLRSPAEAMRFGVESRLVQARPAHGPSDSLVDGPADTPAVLSVHASVESDRERPPGGFDTPHQSQPSQAAGILRVSPPGVLRQRYGRSTRDRDTAEPHTSRTSTWPPAGTSPGHQWGLSHGHGHRRPTK